MKDRGSSTTSREGRLLVVVVVVALAVAAMLGAYLDWVMWPIYSGLTVTIAAALILIAGSIVALVGRGIARRAGLIILAVGFGLVIGQNLGPSREPLIYRSGGTVTLRLEAPFPAIGTSAVDCTNVASGTEFQVTGDPNMRLDTLDRPFVMVYVTKGDRWAAIDDGPRKDGVHLSIAIEDPRVPESGKPSPVSMLATEASTMTASFSNDGGSIRFADLVAQSGPDFSGASVDLAGTLEWTCGDERPDEG